MSDEKAKAPGAENTEGLQDTTQTDQSLQPGAGGGNMGWPHFGKKPVVQDITSREVREDDDLQAAATDPEVESAVAGVAEAMHMSVTLMAERVAVLVSVCESKRGGSYYSDLMQERFGMPRGTASMWRRISGDIHKLPELFGPEQTVRDPRVVYETLKLPNKQRELVREYKGPLTYKKFRTAILGKEPVKKPKGKTPDDAVLPEIDPNDDNANVKLLVKAFDILVNSAEAISQLAEAIDGGEKLTDRKLAAMRKQVIAGHAPLGQALAVIDAMRTLAAKVGKSTKGKKS